MNWYILCISMMYSFLKLQSAAIKISLLISKTFSFTLWIELYYKFCNVESLLYIIDNNLNNKIMIVVAVCCTVATCRDCKVYSCHSQAKQSLISYRKFCILSIIHQVMFDRVGRSPHDVIIVLRTKWDNIRTLIIKILT